MNTIKLIAALCLFVIFSGCGESDNSSDTPLTINGEWNLTNVSGGIAGINDNFSAGTITWTFDSTTNTVEVINNNTNSNLESMLVSGNYEYSLEANATNPELCAYNFVIDEVNFGCYSLTQNQLTFGQIEADGYMITLVR